MTNEMKRGLAQVMYRFGPQSLFDYGRSGLSMRVTRWETEDVGTLEENYIAEHIATLTSNYRNADESPWADLSVDDLDFRRPSRVVGSLYPLVMYCQNRSCGKVVSQAEPEHFYHTRGECPECGSDLRQMTFVLVHDCGNMMQINPQPCSNGAHGFDHLHLAKPNINDASTWYFYCDACGENCGDLTRQCDECHEDRLFYKPIASNSIYYAQGDVLVNLPIDQRYSDDIDYGEGWARILMEGYLGELEDEIEDGHQTLEELAEMTADERDQQRRREQIEELEAELGEENVQQMRDSGLDVADIFEMAEDAVRGNTREEIVDQNRDRVTLPSQRGSDGDPEQAYSTIAHQLFTYMRSTRGFEGDLDAARGMDRQPKPTSLDDLVEDDDFLAANPEASVYPEKLAKAQIESAWVVDNLPLLNFTFGYTRDRPEKALTDLQPFPHPRGDDATPVYADRTPSEAIILQVDREAIVDWLLDRGAITGAEGPDSRDESALKRWFLENVDTDGLQNLYAPVDDELTREIYTLLHTMSHALMRTASGQCGLDSNSISELVMPSVPAIFLYASNTEHFALGGMFTLFKTRIHPWIDETIQDVKRCLYDPVCSHEDGACHACLFTSEIACEGANGDLDRRYLIGSDDGRIPAFWDIE